MRPPGDFSVAELRELVEKIWTGHATYLDGSQVVSQEFIKESGPILSLDLEEMLRGYYPEGVPATELNTVIETYIEIMRSYGFAKPVIFLYHTGKNDGCKLRYATVCQSLSTRCLSSVQPLAAAPLPRNLL